MWENITECNEVTQEALYFPITEELPELSF